MDAENVNHIHLTVPPCQIKPALRSLLHSIIFHRTTDALEPETIEIEDLHVAAVPNPEVEKEIEGKVQQFSRDFLEAGADQGEIAVVFLQRKPRKGWFAMTEELVPWEEHLITLAIDRSPPRRSSSPPPANPVLGALMQVLSFCVENKGNVPPLQGNDMNNSSHQIMISPPPPSELFSPSPPSYPTRLTSPPPLPSLTTTPATATATDLHPPPIPLTAALQDGGRENRRSSSPAIGATGMGYLEQAKEGMRFVGAKAGAVAGWGGRGGARGA